MARTCLNKWFDMTNPGETHTTYTRDTWEIPEAGTEIWCTGWKRAQTIKPYGDGMHVIVGLTCYHCDELMSILVNWEKEGHTWGVDGVKPTREQHINGRWTAVDFSAQRFSGNQTEKTDIQELAEQVDTFLFDNDAFGYGEVFDNPEDFASREFRVTYMSEYLSSPEGRMDTIDHLKQIAENPKQVEEMVKQIEIINRDQETEKKSKDSASSKETRKPREKESEEMER